MSDSSKNISVKNSKRIRTLDLAYIAIGAAIIAVCSWITIPTPVPFTLQTFAVFAILLILGGPRGTLAIVTYVALGAIGVPVFSGFTGGIAVLLGKTGGYIIGFIIIGLLFTAASKFTSTNRLTPASDVSRSSKNPFSSNNSKKTILEIASLILGLLVCYAFGTAWFMYIYMRDTGSIGLVSVLSMCVFPFIVPDLIKLALAYIVARRVRPVIK